VRKVSRRGGKTRKAAHIGKARGSGAARIR